MSKKSHAKSRKKSKSAKTEKATIAQALAAWHACVLDLLGRRLTREERRFRDVCGTRNCSAHSTVGAIERGTMTEVLARWRDEAYHDRIAKAKLQQCCKRRDRFLPDNVPKFIRCYDNGGMDKGGTADRYTVIFTGRYRYNKTGGAFVHLGMSGRPFHPQGIGTHGESNTQPDAREGWPPAIGRSCFLGRRIRFEDLPKDCRRLVLHDYLYLWDLVPEAYETEIDYSVVDQFIRTEDVDEKSE